LAPGAGAGRRRLPVPVAAELEEGTAVRGNGRSNPALFSAYWTDPQSGQRLGRASRFELQEAHRLYREHRRRLRERAA
jgi:hypothetical protein